MQAADPEIHTNSAWPNGPEASQLGLHRGHLRHAACLQQCRSCVEAALMPQSAKHVARLRGAAQQAISQQQAERQPSRDLGGLSSPVVCCVEVRKSHPLSHGEVAAVMAGEAQPYASADVLQT